MPYPTNADLATCEHVSLHGRPDCTEKAQRITHGQVMCEPHAAANDATEAYLAEHHAYIAQQDVSGSECQYDTGHPGGLCGAYTGGGSYCAAHSAPRGRYRSLAERTYHVNDDPWSE